MTGVKDELKPVGKFSIARIFKNSRNGQLTIVLPKKLMKKIPDRIEVSYW